MDTKALRQKVLDLAIRGKLVPQNPNDEPASVLLERIRQQKQQMVKEGKLKAKDIKNDTIIFVGEDNLHYEKFADGSVKCIEDEIPFDLPEGWAWSRMGSLCEYITSGSRGWAQYYSDTGSLFLRMGNLSRDSFKLRMDNLQRVDLPDNVEGTRTRVAENDLLFSITAEIGMLGLIPARCGSFQCSHGPSDLPAEQYHCISPKNSWRTDAGRSADTPPFCPDHIYWHSF